MYIYSTFVSKNWFVPSILKGGGVPQTVNKNKNQVFYKKEVTVLANCYCFHIDTTRMV